MHLRLIAAAILAGLLAPSAHAAESYDNCTGFINSLPATLTTQGVWCMNKDLATGIASGNAITLANNNITIDCNGFKLGGLSAGTATQATGIATLGYLNATVRGCNVRGFGVGVMANGAGHVIEDNRFEANRNVGIMVNGSQSVARRNLVLDTGGATATPEDHTTIGIAVYNDSDAIDNTISGVLPGDNSPNYIHGLVAQGGGSVSNNRIRGVSTSADQIIGIFAFGPSRAVIRDNEVELETYLGEFANAIGIWCGGSGVIARGNSVINFSTPYNACSNSLDNMASSDALP